MSSPTQPDSAAEKVELPPIPEDLRDLYYNCAHFTAETPTNAECIRKLIERIARSEDSRAYFAELHLKQYEMMEAELQAAREEIAKLKTQLKDVLDRESAATKRTPSCRN